MTHSAQLRLLEVLQYVDAAVLAELVTGVLLAALTGWLNDPRYPLRTRMTQATAFVTEAVSVTPVAERPFTGANHS